MSVKIIRKKHNLTQVELAQKLAVDRSTVAKWETGIAAPRIAMLVKISKIFDCSLEELLQEDNIAN